MEQPRDASVKCLARAQVRVGRIARHIREAHYRIRLLASLAGSLLLIILVVRLWPPPGAPDFSRALFSLSGEEVVHLEEVAPTRQQARKPPPPAPLPPVPVPDDYLLPEEIPEVDFSPELQPLEEGEAEANRQGLEGTGRLLRVEEAPRPVRLVEPEYTPAARKKKIRAKIVVEVLIDEQGRVLDARIVERFLLGKDLDDPLVPVDTIGYGLEEAALSAVSRWRFRPARKNGQPVRAYTTLTFRFGV